jgi:hypothetical protein
MTSITKVALKVTLYSIAFSLGMAISTWILR